MFYLHLIVLETANFFMVFPICFVLAVKKAEHVKSIWFDTNHFEHFSQNILFHRKFV